MTVKEAADELEMSISFIYKLMREGQIDYERRGRRKLPVASSLAKYRERNLVAATPTPATKKARPAGPYHFKHLFD